MMINYQIYPKIFKLKLQIDYDALRWERMNSDNSQLVKILYIDPDRDFACFSKKALETDYNFDVEIVHSFSEAHEKLEKKCYEAVLSSFVSPIKYGLLFIGNLVKTKSNPPIILFTDAKREDVIKALHRGATGYVNKNGGPQTVYDELAHFILQAIQNKQKENMLFENQNRSRALADYMYDWEYWTSPIARLLFVSPSCKRMTGYSAEEFIANPKLLYEIVHPDDKPSLKDHFTIITKEPTHIRDFRIITKDGQTRWLSHACQPAYDENGNFIGRRISNRDITDRKNAEEALGKSEKRWEATLSSIGDAVIATDTEAKITFMNKIAEKATGWLLSEVSGKPLGKVFHIINENTCKIVENPVTKVLQKGIVVGLANHTLLVRKDGSKVPIDDSGAPIKGKDGKITGAVLVFRDITERRKVQDALEASERRYHQLFTSMAEQFQLFELVFDQKGNPVDYRLLDVNPSFEQLVGKTREQLIGKQVIKELWPVEQYWLDAFNEVLKTGKPNRIENYGSAFGRHYDLCIYRVNETQLASIGNDVTERKAAEQELARNSEKLELLVKERTAQLETAQQQLVKSERLAAIGELAGMIGHDLRNPLTGIKTSIYFLKKNMPAEPKTKEMIEIIEKCIDHSNKIINDLLEYSREIQLQIFPCTPKILIVDTIEMMKTPGNVTIINMVSSDARVHVDYDKMKRVFSNLIKNSIEAMPNGGRLTITCAQTRDSFEFLFADTGPGIPADIVQKIFAPLVTTKAQGMGFGLAICRRIVEAHGGVITVETSTAGTTFTVKVPMGVLESKPVGVHLKASFTEKEKQ
jgi:PAS domain S-box-containing protein